MGKRAAQGRGVLRVPGHACVKLRVTWFRKERHVPANLNSIGLQDLRLLDRLGPMEYEDLFTVLATLAVTREEYFEEVCRELAELERG